MTHLDESQKQNWHRFAFHFQLQNLFLPPASLKKLLLLRASSYSTVYPSWLLITSCHVPPGFSPELKALALEFETSSVPQVLLLPLQRLCSLMCLPHTTARPHFALTSSPLGPMPHGRSVTQCPDHTLGLAATSHSVSPFPTLPVCLDHPNRQSSGASLRCQWL